MTFTCNRFAVVPHMCSECKRYIWLESYRRSDVWKLFVGRYVKENICKSCLKKFDIGSKEFERTKLPSFEDIFYGGEGKR